MCIQRCSCTWASRPWCTPHQLLDRTCHPMEGWVCVCVCDVWRVTTGMSCPLLFVFRLSLSLSFLPFSYHTVTLLSQVVLCKTKPLCVFAAYGRHANVLRLPTDKQRTNKYVCACACVYVCMCVGGDECMSVCVYVCVSECECVGVMVCIIWNRNWNSTVLVWVSYDPKRWPWTISLLGHFFQATTTSWQGDPCIPPWTSEWSQSPTPLT